MSRFRHLYNFSRFPPKRAVDEDIISFLKQYSDLNKKQKLELLTRIKQSEKKLNDWRALAFPRGSMNRYSIDRNDMNVYKELTHLFANTFQKDPEMKSELDGWNMDRLFRDAEQGPYRYIAPRNSFN
ncbi:MAG: hypothetical protein ACC656_09605 [Candidatus Heimdallarchaeota archaeon]